MRTLRRGLWLTLAVFGLTSAGIDLPGGRGGSKLINPTGERATFPGPVEAGNPGLKWAGCALPACAGAVTSQAFLQSLQGPLFEKQETRPHGRATFIVGREGAVRLAVIEEGNRARVLQRFELTALHRTYLLQVGRGTRASASEAWKFEPIPRATEPIWTEVLNQLRLPTRAGGQKLHEGVKWLEYRMDDALLTGVRSTPNPSLLEEAVRWLGVAAAPLLEEALADPKLGEFEKAPPVKLICTTDAAVPLRQLVRDQVKPAQGGWVSAAALGCLEGTAAEVIRPYLLEVVALLCGGPTGALALIPEVHAWALRLKVYDQFLAGLNKCSSPERRQLVQACVAPETKRHVLEAALREGGPEADEALLGCLDPPQEHHRGAVAAALARDEVARVRGLHFLSAGPRPPSAEELFAVATAYAREPPAQGRDFYRWRAEALEYFSRARREPERTETARQTLRSVLQVEETPPAGVLDQLGQAARKVKRLGIDSIAPAMRVGLAVLGEREQELPAARRVGRKFPAQPKEVTDSEGLAAYGLRLCGCEETEVKAAARRAVRKPAASGEVCGSDAGP